MLEIHARGNLSSLVQEKNTSAEPKEVALHCIKHTKEVLNKKKTSASSRRCWKSAQIGCLIVPLCSATMPRVTTVNCPAKLLVSL